MIAWLRFEWDLKQPIDGAGRATPPYVLRSAEKSEEDAVQKVVTSAFSMDTGWGDIYKFLAESLTKGVTDAFAKEKPDCVVLQHGTRIIGASVLDSSESAENNLLTGPCILHEYRSRGLGSLLLIASLSTLREGGLKRASGVTREKSTAARFVYTKCHGVSSPWRPDFEPKPRLAA